MEFSIDRAVKGHLCGWTGEYADCPEKKLVESMSAEPSGTSEVVFVPDDEIPDYPGRVLERVRDVLCDLAEA